VTQTERKPTKTVKTKLDGPYLTDNESIHILNSFFRELTWMWWRRLIVLHG